MTIVLLTFGFKAISSDRVQAVQVKLSDNCVLRLPAELVLSANYANVYEFHKQRTDWKDEIAGVVIKKYPNNGMQKLRNENFYNVTNIYSKNNVDVFKIVPKDERLMLGQFQFWFLVDGSVVTISGYDRNKAFSFFERCLRERR